jgi:hypothetical protein
MKIIEPGKAGEKWSMQHRCTAWGNFGMGCDALLELEFDDLRYFPGTGGTETWGYRDPAVSFKCPCCGKLTDLGTNDWPKCYKDLTRWTKEWQDAIPEVCLE